MNLRQGADFNFVRNKDGEEEKDDRTTAAVSEVAKDTTITAIFRCGFLYLFIMNPSLKKFDRIGLKYFLF